MITRQMALSAHMCAGGVEKFCTLLNIEGDSVPRATLEQHITARGLEWGRVALILARWPVGATGIQAANLRGADLREANLSEADLSKADLSGADLSKADLTRVPPSDPLC